MTRNVKVRHVVKRVLFCPLWETQAEASIAAVLGPTFDVK